jgi:hypothetical protein
MCINCRLGFSRTPPTMAFSTVDGRDASFANDNLPYQPSNFASSSSVWDNPNCVMLLVDNNVQNYTLAIRSCDAFGVVVCTVGGYSSCYGNVSVTANGHDNGAS